MQKKLLWLLIPIGLVLLFKMPSQPSKKTSGIPIPTQKIQEIISHNPKKSIFVPYWASKISEGDLSYVFYYYFGVRPTKDGSIENEVGYQKISLLSSIPEKQKKLVLRMLDPSITEVLLQDKSAQKTLISAVKSILSKNTFSGIVIDMEVPFTLQANKEKEIANFVQQMCTDIHADYKSCSMLVYGDFSYRNRPYDLKKLGEYTDKILLMAYDFHKASGEPGPNFSFEEKQKYGYDFKTMVNDAIILLPKEKIEVVFGMYGYDWTLNEQGTPLKSAKALTLKEIQALNSNSKMLRSNSAREKNIQYVDAGGQKHIIWYEDEESVAVKTKYLQEQGIWQTSFWAQSYF